MRPGKLKSRFRAGFTLVELLVVVLIITILASITLFALFNAGEAAKKARTRAQIAKIHDLLMPVWESYITRRVPVAISAGTHPNAARKFRVDGLRELMRMELPDRKSDVIDPPTLAGLVRPALSQAYKRKADAVTTWDATNQGSECLYLILSRLRDGETTGLEFFQEVEIGDLDGDQMPEILDAWGANISFLRWAPGFIAPSVIQKGTDPDPLDPSGVYSGTFALFPLVYSGGPDKDKDIWTEPTHQYSATSPNKNDPFKAAAGGVIGTPMEVDDPPNGVGWQDNIHNHMSDISIR